LLSVDRSNINVQNIFNENDSVVIKVLKQVIKTCTKNSIETFVGGQIADNENFIRALSDSGLTGVSVNPDLGTILKTKKLYQKIEKQIL
jgi:pyruvate,water dikinase